MSNEEDKDKLIAELENELLEMKSVVRAYDDTVNKILPREIAILFMNSTPQFYNRHHAQLIESREIKKMNL